MKTIRASEIGQYVYCRRAWWLGQIQNESSANVMEMRAGVRAHERHGARVAFSNVLVWLGYGALVAAALLLFSGLVN